MTGCSPFPISWDNIVPIAKSDVSVVTVKGLVGSSIISIGAVVSFSLRISKAFCHSSFHWYGSSFLSKEIKGNAIEENWGTNFL